MNWYQLETKGMWGCESRKKYMGHQEYFIWTRMCLDQQLQWLEQSEALWLWEQCLAEKCSWRYQTRLDQPSRAHIMLLWGKSAFYADHLELSQDQWDESCNKLFLIRDHTRSLRDVSPVFSTGVFYRFEEKKYYSSELGSRRWKLKKNCFLSETSNDSKWFGLSAPIQCSIKLYRWQ